MCIVLMIANHRNRHSIKEEEESSITYRKRNPNIDEIIDAISGFGNLITIMQTQKKLLEK